MVLAPKKSVALQAGRAPSPDVAPVSSRSDTDVAVLLAGQALPAVAPMPSAGQAGTKAEEAPSEVAEQTTVEVTPPPTLERMELPPTLVVPSMVGAASQAEVAMTVTSQA